MHRFLHHQPRKSLWLRVLLACCAAAVLAAPAAAFERRFPPAAKRGALSPAAYPEIVIDGNLRRLAPGARIWNENNLIALPASIRGSALPVNYTEDARQQIDRIWILTADEARQPLPSPTPSQSQ